MKFFEVVQTFPSGYTPECDNDSSCTMSGSDVSAIAVFRNEETGEYFAVAYAKDGGLYEIDSIVVDSATTGVDNGSETIATEIYNASKNGSDSLRTIASRHNIFGGDATYVASDFARMQSNRHGREYLEKLFFLNKVGAECALSGGLRCVVSFAADAVGAPAVSRGDIRQMPHGDGEFEAYKDSLRRRMEKPVVSDSKLAELISMHYREGATVGSGSTADAVRHELATGEKVGGRLHSIKARDGVRALEKWLAQNPTAKPSDRAAAYNVMRDMEQALGGE